MFLSVMLLAACAAGAPLFVDPATVDFKSNKMLLDRLVASPHGYFRFINIKFSQEVCRRFSDVLDEIPQVNLHGDAHLEQYAITDLGRGLTDFDDTSVGPAVIDLVRFGVSLELTLRARGWQARSAELYDRFLDAYLAALDDPKMVAPSPMLAEEAKKKFTADRVHYFEWIGSVMKRLKKTDVAKIAAAMKPYVEAMRAEMPSLRPEFFDIVDTGRLQMGIGSALDKKYLVRVKGATDDPLDDLILEVKEVRDLSGISCIQPSRGGNAFRVLVGQSRIAYAPYRYLGYLRFDDRTFWIHSWVDNYRELESPDSFPTPAALAEVVYDIGVQLGLGHPNRIAAPLDLQFRRALIDMVKSDRDRLRRTSVDLADMTEVAWQRFKTSVRDGS